MSSPSTFKTKSWNCRSIFLLYFNSRSLICSSISFLYYLRVPKFWLIVESCLLNLRSCALMFAVNYLLLIFASFSWSINSCWICLALVEASSILISCFWTSEKTSFFYAYTSLSSSFHYTRRPLETSVINSLCLSSINFPPFASSLVQSLSVSKP